LFDAGTCALLNRLPMVGGQPKNVKKQGYGPDSEMEPELNL
jgi:hypothetical protein